MAIRKDPDCQSLDPQVDGRRGVRRRTSAPCVGLYCLIIELEETHMFPEGITFLALALGFMGAAIGIV
jgi:hypothetical protein